jgi:hypothetical protein
MSLARLTIVELQLVMQCCDPGSLLAMAQCCRRSFQAANSAFAWRFCAPLWLSLSSHAQWAPYVLCERESGRCLLHHAPGFGLRLEDTPSGTKKEVVRQTQHDELAFVARMPRLVALDASAATLLQFSHWKRLLHQHADALRGITILRTNALPWRAAYRHDFPCHPRLSTLLPSLREVCMDGWWGGLENHLRELEPQLTCIRLTASSRRSLFRVAGRCSALRRLELCSFLRNTKRYVTLLSSPRVSSQLQSLVLDGHPPTPGTHSKLALVPHDPFAWSRLWFALANALKALAALTELEIRNIGAVDMLLSVLAKSGAMARSLRRLTFEPLQLNDRSVVSGAHADVFPSLKSLQAVMSALPCCVRVLHLPLLPMQSEMNSAETEAAPAAAASASNDDNNSNDNAALVGALSSRQHVQQWLQLQAEYPKRVRLVGPVAAFLHT